jgi:hypothetical protein
MGIIVDQEHLDRVIDEMAADCALIDAEADIHELHRLIAAGLGDSPEAEAIRDRLDVPLRVVSQDQHETLRRLSEELYGETGRTA